MRNIKRAETFCLPVAYFALLTGGSRNNDGDPIALQTHTRNGKKYVSPLKDLKNTLNLSGAPVTTPDEKSNKMMLKMRLMKQR